MSTHLRFSSLLLLTGLLSTPSSSYGEMPSGIQQNPPVSDAVMREIRHQDPQWEAVKPHLPDPATATEQQLGADCKRCTPGAPVSGGCAGIVTSMRLNAEAATKSCY